MHQPKKYRMIGLMSGTSLDGVDLAYCEFEWKDNNWSYTIPHAETIPYNATWKTRLNELAKQPMFLFPKTDAFLGKYFGQLSQKFIQKYNLTVDGIASHGHTIFHAPNEGYTAQIGSGASIYAETGIRTITNFRVVDVAFGGQGAPLVPIGDELLFREYDACLNLGGFSNISFSQHEQRIAFDVSPCNTLFNTLAKHFNQEYDPNGELAAQGLIHTELLDALNRIEYYHQSPPKSLGIEWLNATIWPLVTSYDISAIDLMATLNLHVATQLANVVNQYQFKQILLTGGGAYNATLVNHLKSMTSSSIIRPNNQLINFKEALIFAFLGVLRLEGQHNALSSVTGSLKNSTNGCIWG